MRYVDGYVLPVPKKNLPAYRRMAQKAAGIWREHGALEYRECVGDDLEVKAAAAFGVVPFPRGLKLKRGETVVFSWVVFKSRAHRDRVNAKVMSDPRLAKMPKPMPFDVKRMIYGGFKALVAAQRRWTSWTPSCGARELQKGNLSHDSQALFPSAVVLLPKGAHGLL